LLQNILYKVKLVSVSGSTDIDVNDLQIDSRKISAGGCFIAIKGLVSDGHDYIDTAIKNGAVAIVCQELPAVQHENVHYISVENSAAAAAIMAHNFYGQPSTKLKLTGVTGTNGKTTIATLLFNLFTELGYTCGLISTVQNQ